jgi:hypothetical protein
MKLGPKLMATLLLPEGTKGQPIKPRKRAGPERPQMSEVELQSLQQKVFNAVRDVLPPGWEFVCGLMGPAGERELVGSLHQSPQSRQFLETLSKAMKTDVWTLPPK